MAEAFATIVRMFGGLVLFITARLVHLLLRAVVATREHLLRIAAQHEQENNHEKKTVA